MLHAIAYINSFKRNNRDILLLLKQYYRITNQQFLKIFSNDERFITRKYTKKTKRRLNLVTPQRYTEKLQWLKLYYRDPNMVICADKWAVRQYVKEMGYEGILNECYEVYDSVMDIEFDQLPDKFVLKATHGSNMNLIVSNKANVKWGVWKKIIRTWMLQDISIYGREWVYKEIKPRIICEKYLNNENDSLKDYKFICSYGKILFIQADSDRYSCHKQSYYDVNWNMQNFSTGASNGCFKKPKLLYEMEKIAKDLSSRFPFSRVDLYYCNEQIFFGELTFFGASGFFSFTPDEYDFFFGRQIDLPVKNFG